MKEFSYIDDLFAAIYLAGIENGIGRQLTQKEAVHRKEAFIKNNPLHRDAKEGFKAAMLEAIGTEWHHNSEVWCAGANARRKHVIEALETLVNSKGQS